MFLRLMLRLCSLLLPGCVVFQCLLLNFDSCPAFLLPSLLALKFVSFSLVIFPLIFHRGNIDPVATFLSIPCRTGCGPLTTMTSSLMYHLLTLVYPLTSPNKSPCPPPYSPPLLTLPIKATLFPPLFNPMMGYMILDVA